MFCHTHLTPCYTQKNAQAKEPLLSHSELETLLHEFGHVLHSVLGRTQFQHLSGTRSVADVVEVIVFCGVFLCYSCCFASKVADLEVLSVFCNFEVVGVCGSEGLNDLNSLRQWGAETPQQSAAARGSSPDAATGHLRSLPQATSSEPQATSSQPRSYAIVSSCKLQLSLDAN